MMGQNFDKHGLVTKFVEKWVVCPVIAAIAFVILYVLNDDREEDDPYA